LQDISTDESRDDDTIIFICYLDLIRAEKARWKTFFNVDIEPLALPANLEEILNAPCPFWGKQGKRVKDTHMLTFIPSEIQGARFVLQKLKEMLEKINIPNRYCRVSMFQKEWCRNDPWECIKQGSARWVLLTKECVPDTFTEMEVLTLFNHVVKLQECKYFLPTATDAVVSIVMEFLTSGTMLFPAPIFTCCVDTYKPDKTFRQLIVGGFSKESLSIGYHKEKSNYHGIAGCRTL